MDNIIKNKFITYNLSMEEQIIGLSVDQIKDLEQTTKVTLPRIYKKFMMLCGRKVNNFYHDLTFFILR